ncbi:MAG: hypothetical protein ACLQGP_27930 [Isosphaeraceae bacterium]
MSILKSPRAKILLLLASLILPSNLVGCGSGNTNEKEFLSSAPPGKPPENPDETVSERRARTRLVSKKVADAEAKNAAAAKRLEEQKKKKTP